MTDRLTHCGKQVFLDGQHFADAVTPEAAEVICIMLNNGTFSNRDVTPDDFVKVERFFE